MFKFQLTFTVNFQISVLFLLFLVAPCHCSWCYGVGAETGWPGVSTL